MKRIILTLLLATVMCCKYAVAQQSQEGFIVSDIRIVGLQRIAEGTIFTFLPLEAGDRLTPSIARQSVRELFRSGFFQDVQFGRDGDILIISVKERPAISSLSFTGNKAIETEDLLGALASIGLAEGETYNPVDLDRVSQELVRQYFNQGKYAVEVSPTVRDLERNRVSISIDVVEGDTAKIKHINVVGNTVYTDGELTEEFESATTNLLSFINSDDQYSEDKLNGDLEVLRSFYQDRGYVDFSIESVQVSISPDKRDVFITANVREGDVYTISDVKITGDLIVQESTLRRLLLTQPGEVFSRNKMERSIDNMTALLSNIGYAFANINPVPNTNQDDRTVELTYVIEPGKRVYVRRIAFQGNTKTKDEVLRREMRQFEGAWFSQAAVDRSRIRLQRLSYFEDVNIETPPVPGSDDQVDVIVSVTERPSGSFTIGLGFSQVQGLIATLGLQQDNFLGSGKNVGLQISRSSIRTAIGINYNNPYWLDSGVSRGFFVNYSEFNPGDANISIFNTDSISGGVNFGFPLSEVDFISGGISASSTDVNIGTPIVLEGDELGLFANRPLAASLDFNGNDLIDDGEDQINTYQVSASWNRDTSNSFLFPTRGSRQNLSAEVSGPGSTREFYKLFYRYSKFWPVYKSLVFSARANIGYGDAYDNFDEERQVEEIPIAEIPGIALGEGPNGELAVLSGPGGDPVCQAGDVVSLDGGLPFYEHFFAGGVRDIRGYDDNTLGPQDQFCRAVGGDFKLSGGFELSIPAPFGGGGSKVALFLDAGQVYQDITDYETGELRGSVGLSLTWQAPVGPVTISYAFPIKDEFGDNTEALQFSFGTIF